MNQVSITDYAEKLNPIKIGMAGAGPYQISIMYGEVNAVLKRTPPDKTVGRKRRK